jgi:glycosyltransferase involved in cell wall biosynthesis
MSADAVCPDRLTIVVAAFDEDRVLPVLHARVAGVLDALAREEGIEGRVLYVDDGSTDATWQVMQALAAGDLRVALLRLSRNFGKEAALTAGLDRVTEGAAMILDADGQDPPELIPQFIAKWREGYDDVHGTRLVRKGEGWLKKSTAHGLSLIPI